MTVSRTKSSWVFILTGIAIVLVAVASSAEWIMLGETPGFGSRELLLAMAGLALAALGLAIAVHRSSSSFRQKESLLQAGLFGVLITLVVAISTAPIWTSWFYPLRETPEMEYFLNHERSEILLRELIYRDYPKLRNESLSDIETVSLLREWAAANMDYATGSGMLDRANPTINRGDEFRYYERDAPTIFAGFIADRGGTLCRGHAYALHKLYDLWGLKSFRVHYGSPGTGATHVIVLVEIEREGRKILSIQDGHWNIEYRDTNGEPIDYFELLELLKVPQHKDIVTIGPESNFVRDHIGISSDSMTARTRDFLSIWDFEREFRRDIYSLLAEHSLPKDLLYLHLFVGAVEDLEPNKRQEFLRKVLKIAGAWAWIGTE